MRYVAKQCIYVILAGRGGVAASQGAAAWRCAWRGDTSVGRSVA